MDADGKNSRHWTCNRFLICLGDLTGVACGPTSDLRSTGRISRGKQITAARGPYFLPDAVSLNNH